MNKIRASRRRVVVALKEPEKLKKQREEVHSGKQSGDSGAKGSKGRTSSREYEPVPKGWRL
jgi:hypothetical protein